MKFSNKLNLPESFIKYVASQENHELKPHRYSATELLNPTRMILLTRRHYNELEKDISDYIPALFGTAVHSVLEQFADLDKTEVQVETEFGDDVITGRIDYLDLKNNLIVDYKTTTCGKISREDFEDWRTQGLIYAYLVYKHFGVVIRHLKFIALLKDWSVLRPTPASPVYIYEYTVQDSDYDYIGRFIKGKLEEINYYLTLGSLPECTDEEKWNTGSKYAYYKRGYDKRAKAVFDTREEAEDYKAQMDEGLIVERPGECRRCKYYCDVCKFCNKGGNIE